MTRRQQTEPEERRLAKGIKQITRLPSPNLGSLWDSIFIDPTTKRQLVSQGVLNFTVRTKVASTVLPLHGVILLVGRPGTGKTSLAKGLANRIAESVRGAAFTLVEVEPHSLMSSAMGKTQRAVLDLFEIAISEIAATGPTIVLLDEVETLAADRAKLSLEANPIDIHRATDAVLVQLDAVAQRFPNLLFIATSNFPKAIDDAFTSRCDFVLQVPLPDASACERILRDTIEKLADTFPKVRELLSDKKFQGCAVECEGLDGRAIRKVVASALAVSPESAIDPNKLSLSALLHAISHAKTVKVHKLGD